MLQTVTYQKYNLYSYVHDFLGKIDWLIPKDCKDKKKKKNSSQCHYKPPLKVKAHKYFSILSMVAIKYGWFFLLSK